MKTEGILPAPESVPRHLRRRRRGPGGEKGRARPDDPLQPERARLPRHQRLRPERPGREDIAGPGRGPDRAGGEHVARRRRHVLRYLQTARRSLTHDKTHVPACSCPSRPRALRSFAPGLGGRAGGRGQRRRPGREDRRRHGRDLQARRTRGGRHRPQGRADDLPQGLRPGRPRARRAGGARHGLPPRLDHQAVHGRVHPHAGPGRQAQAPGRDHEVPAGLSDPGQEDHGRASPDPHVRDPELHRYARVAAALAQGFHGQGARRSLQGQAHAVRAGTELGLQQLRLRPARGHHREGLGKDLRGIRHGEDLQAAGHEGLLLRPHRPRHSPARPRLSSRARAASSTPPISA